MKGTDGSRSTGMAREHGGRGEHLSELGDKKEGPSATLYKGKRTES